MLALCRVHWWSGVDGDQLINYQLLKASTSLSLVLQSLKFGYLFPHDTFPLHSIQSSCSPLFHTYFSLSTTSIHPNLDLSLLLPPSGSSCSNFCTVLSPSILTTRPSHSNLLTSITVTWRFEFIIKFFIHFYFWITIFICWPIYFFSFPTSLRLFPFYLLGWRKIQYHKLTVPLTTVFYPVEN